MEGKSPIDSLTIQSATVIFVALVKILFDLDIEEAEAHTIIAGLFALLGVLGVIVGRARATKPLRLNP